MTLAARPVHTTALAVGLALLCLPAAARAEAPAVAMDRLLEERQVEGSALGSWLAVLDPIDCLVDQRGELEAALGDLRALHLSALGDVPLPRLWRTWEPRLRSFSPEGRRLVEWWLTHPSVARREFFCEDGLPLAWRQLDAEGFVLEAVSWYDAAIADRSYALSGSAGGRELAIMELIELGDDLLDRFDATYPDTEAERRALLADRLGLMWRVMIRPLHRGFQPREWEEGEPTGAPGPQRRRVPNIFAGIPLYEPRELAERDRVRRNWRREQRVLDREIEETSRELDAVLVQLEAETDPVEAAELLRQAEEIDSRLAGVASALARLSDRVLRYSSGRPIIDGLIARGPKRTTIRRLERSADTSEEPRAELRETRAELEQRMELPEPSVPTGGDPDEPGPGNWLAGLPGAESYGSATASTDALAGSGAESQGEPIEELPEGWVERVYEGPLAPPGLAWSPGLVAAVQRRHAQLDATDVRLLLSLAKAAWGDRTVAEIESAIRQSLATRGGLRLRGGEETLSDLWRSSPDQEVVFILALPLR